MDLLWDVTAVGEGFTTCGAAMGYANRMAPTSSSLAWLRANGHVLIYQVRVGLYFNTIGHAADKQRGLRLT